MPVTLGKLDRKLLHAGSPHGEDPLPFALRQLHLLVKGLSNSCLRSGASDGCLPLGALGVAALSRLELVLFRGPTWTDLVLLLRRRLGRDGIVTCVGLIVRAMIELIYVPSPFSVGYCWSGPSRFVLPASRFFSTSSKVEPSPSNCAVLPV